MEDYGAYNGRLSMGAYNGRPPGDYGRLWEAYSGRLNVGPTVRDSNGRLWARSGRLGMGPTMGCANGRLWGL